jgi:hypothetical protein
LFRVTARVEEIVGTRQQATNNHMMIPLFVSKQKKKKVNDDLASRIERVDEERIQG